MSASAATARFFAKVRKTETCWLWTAATVNGYGRFYVNARKNMTPAHRWSYEAHVGPIPEGMELDHLCRVRNCVNPDHLEPVTHTENVGRRPIATHCKYGHELNEANTYWEQRETSRPTPRCRTCNRIRVNAHNARKRLGVSA